MKRGLTNIILISIVIFHSSASHAEGSGFAFNVHKLPAAKKYNNNKSDFNPSKMSWDIGMQGLLLPDFLKSSGKLVYGRFNENSHTGFSDWDRYLLKLGVSGKKQQFGYGVNLYSIGQDFDGSLSSEDQQRKGHLGYETWVSLDINKFQLKTAFSESWINDQTHEQLYELESNYPLFSKPDISVFLTYGFGHRKSINTSNLAVNNIGAINSLKAKFLFVDDYLNLSTEFKQFSLNNEFDDRIGYKQNIIYISSTLFPHHPLSVISSYRHSLKNHSTATDSRKLNKSESTFNLVYKFREIPTLLKLSSSYKRYHSTDGLSNGAVVKFAANFDWKPQKIMSGISRKWSVGLKYKDWKNNATPSLSTDNWSVNLSCRWSFAS